MCCISTSSPEALLPSDEFDIQRIAADAELLDARGQFPMKYEDGTLGILDVENRNIVRSTLIGKTLNGRTKESVLFRRGVKDFWGQSKVPERFLGSE